MSIYVTDFQYDISIITGRSWLPTDMDAFFNFSFFLFIKTKQTFQNKTGLSIPVKLNASKRKEGTNKPWSKWPFSAFFVQKT